MNIVLVRMAQLMDATAVCHEAALPANTTLKALSSTIQKVFALGCGDAFEYEVLGCRSPGCRGRLRDLVASGVTCFCYLHHGARKSRVEIVIIPMPRGAFARSTA